MVNNVCWFNLFKLRFLGDSFLPDILGHGEAVLTFLGVVIFIIPIFIDLHFLPGVPIFAASIPSSCLLSSLSSMLSSCCFPLFHTFPFPFLLVDVLCPKSITVIMSTSPPSFLVNSFHVFTLFLVFLSPTFPSTELLLSFLSFAGLLVNFLACIHPLGFICWGKSCSVIELLLLLVGEIVACFAAAYCGI